MNLARLPFIKRPIHIIGFRDISIIVIVFRIHLITHRTRHHHFRSHKAVYVLSISYSTRFILAPPGLLAFVFFFVFGITSFVTHPHLPTPTPTSGLFVPTPFPLFRPLSLANSFYLRHNFLDAVSHHTFHLFLALGFDEIE